MRKLAVFTFLITIVVFNLAGCNSDRASLNEDSQTTPFDSANEMPPQIFRINAFTEPPTADPGILDDTASDMIARATFEGLTRIGRDNLPYEAAAEKIEVSTDLLTYTFTIRDANWSNGDKVTASDFEYAWKRVLTPETASKSVDKMYYIKNGEKAYKGEVALNEVGVKTVNEKTLQVTLETPTPFFLEMVAYPTFYPINKQVVESNPQWAMKADTHIGNGPFKMVEWEPKNKMTFVKNEHYWDKDAVKLDKIEVSMINDSSTELAMFENGELDYVGSPLGAIPLDAMPALKESGKLISQPIAAIYIYKFNTNQPPFTNVKIRKAFAYAIDRQAIIDNVLQGNQLPALSLLPPSMMSSSAGYFKDADVETAKKLLVEGMNELGITKLPTITLSYNTSEANKKIVEAVQDQWKKALGVPVELENQEWAVFLEKVQLQNYQIARTGWAGQYNDPINFLEPYKEKNGVNNSTGWENARYKELLTQSFVEADSVKRKGLLAGAEQILMDEMPIIPIYFYTNNYVKRDNVDGIFVSATGTPDWKWVSIQK